MQLIESREHQRDLPKHVIKLIHKKHDHDNNGKLDYREFELMMTNPDNEALFGHLMNRYIKTVIPRRRMPEQTTVVDGDFEDEYTCCPPPVGMLLISLMITVIFIVDKSQRERTVDGPIATVLVYDPHRRREVWRYITYMFVHVG